MKLLEANCLLVKKKEQPNSAYSTTQALLKTLASAFPIDTVSGKNLKAQGEEEFISWRAVMWNLEFGR